jgi:hypothetical protein
VFSGRGVGDVEPVLEVVRGPAVPQVGEDGAVGHGGALPPAALLRAAHRHLRRRLLHRRRRCRHHRAALQGQSVRLNTSTLHPPLLLHSAFSYPRLQ